MRMRRDDFVLHDDFLSLFPQYWASVPLGFDYVVVGQIPRHFDTGNYTVEGAAPVLICDKNPVASSRSGWWNIEMSGCQ